MSSRGSLRLASALLVLAVVGAGCTRPPADVQQQAWTADLERLQADQDSLRKRSMELIAQDERIARVPQGEVVIGVPTSFVQDVIERLFEDVANHVTLRLSGIKVHTAKTVRKVVTIGEFVVDVDIDRVVGRIEPGKPRITFGDDLISLALPIAVTRGQGEATVRFQWDGKNVADLACGDLDITRKVTGTVIPADYLVSGTLRLETRGRRVFATPHFPETKVRIRVKPSQASWDTVNAILEEKRGVCGFVLDKVDVPGILSRVTELDGFNVKLPVDKLRAALVPAGVSDSVTVSGRTLAIQAETKTVRIDSDAIWYSASVKLETAHPAADSVLRRPAPDPSP